jgi:hypothetical protein
MRIFTPKTINRCPDCGWTTKSYSEFLEHRVKCLRINKGGNIMDDLKFTVDRPSPNTQKVCEQRLLERDLLHGSAFVFRFGGKYYGAGDRDHCPTAITHNLAKLLEILKYGDWSYVGKAYDSDMYFSKQRISPVLKDTFAKEHTLEELN